TVSFSQPVTGLTSSGVTLGGTAGGTKTIIVTGSDSTYNVAVSGMTDGTVTASVSAAAASDGAGNANTASTSIDNSVTYDTTPPTASAITTANKTGGTQGKAEAGDTVTMPYNEGMAATSLLQ